MPGLRWLGNVVTTGTFVLIVAGLIASGLAAGPLARRFHLQRLRLFLCLAVTSLIIAVTWPLDSVAAFRLVGDSFDLGALTTWWRQGWGSVFEDVLRDVDGQMNIVLFVPAGFLRTLTTKHAGRVLVALVGLSFVVESIQAVSDLRAADPRDLVSNSAGAALGVLIALAWMAAARGWGPADAHGTGSVGDRRTSRRSLIAGVLATVIVVAFAYQYVERKADQQREILLVDLRGVFGRTTSTDIAPLLAENGDFERFLSMAVVRPDSVQTVGGNDIEARYRTEFGPAERCVFVRWSPTSSTFRLGGGSECTDFIG